MGSAALHFVSFGRRLRCVLQRENGRVSTLRLAKSQRAFSYGDGDSELYFVQAGLIKVLGLSRGGKDCLLEICAANDVFGDLSTADDEGAEAAIAMQDTILQHLPCAHFLDLLTQHDLLLDYVKYLAERVALKNKVITEFSTVGCEYRLGSTLLRLCRKLGRPGCPGAREFRIEQRLSHQELSEMVGTTRPRVSEFMHRFHELGLVETTPDSFLVVKKSSLVEYLEEMTQGRQPNPRKNLLCLSNSGLTPACPSQETSPSTQEVC